MVASTKVNLTDITPERHRCANASSMCPAVLMTDNRSYVVIGKTVDVDDPDDEMIVLEISKELLEDAIASQINQTEEKAQSDT